MSATSPTATKEKTEALKKFAAQNSLAFQQMAAAFAHAYPSTKQLTASLQAWESCAARYSQEQQQKIIGMALKLAKTTAMDTPTAIKVCTRAAANPAWTREDQHAIKAELARCTTPQVAEELLTELRTLPQHPSSPP